MIVGCTLDTGCLLSPPHSLAISAVVPVFQMREGRPGEVRQLAPADRIVDGRACLRADNHSLMGTRH